MLTDTKGQALYGYDVETGILSKYDGKQFNAFADTDIEEEMFKYLKKKGYSNYDIRHLITVKPQLIRQPAYTDNKLYHYITVEYTPSVEAPGEEIETTYYLASIDYTSNQPQWTFTETKSLEEMFGAYELNADWVGMNGKLYLIGAEGYEDRSPSTPFTGSYDPATGACKREKAMPRIINKMNYAVKDGKLYAMFGDETVVIENNVENIFNTEVYCFDGSEWKKITDIPYEGDDLSKQHHTTYQAKGACAAVADGLLFLDCPAQGLGNAFLYNTQTQTFEPLYITFNEYKPDPSQLYSAVETKDGVYYIRQQTDGNLISLCMYLLPADSGSYTPSYSDMILGDADGDGKITIHDATMIQKYLAKFAMPDNFVLKACDTNGDGIVSISDATAIQRYLAAMDAPEGIGNPANTNS